MGGRFNRRGHCALSSKYVVDSTCKIHSSPEKVILVHRGKTTTLNHHAMYAVSLCNGTNTLENVLKIINDKYDVTTEAASKIIAYMNTLYSKGIMVKSVSCSPPEWLYSYSDSICEGMYHPHSLSVELTNYCNIECSFCYRDATRRVADNFHEPISFLRDRAREGVNWIEFTGGEPLLHPSIDDILSYALSEFQNVGIITNGHLLSSDIINLLSEHRDKSFVQISLPTIHKTRYKHITGSDSIDLVLANIKKVCENGIRLRVATLILDDESIAEIEAIVERVLSMGVDMITPGTVVDYGRGHLVESTISLSSTTKLVKKLKKLKALYGNRLGWEPWDEQTSFLSNRVNCGAGSSRFCYDPKGNIRPCAMFPHAFGVNMKLDAVKMKRMRELQEPGGKECLECEYYNNCRGCILRGWTKSLEIEERCRWSKVNNVKEIFAQWRVSTD